MPESWPRLDGTVGQWILKFLCVLTCMPWIIMLTASKGGIFNRALCVGLLAFCDSHPRVQLNQASLSRDWLRYVPWMTEYFILIPLQHLCTYESCKWNSIQNCSLHLVDVCKEKKSKSIRYFLIIANRLQACVLILTLLQTDGAWCQNIGWISFPSIQSWLRRMII